MTSSIKLWCGAGSNRRHKDFQSFALPTELPHLPFPFGAANIGAKYKFQKTNSKFHFCYFLQFCEEKLKIDRINLIRLFLRCLTKNQAYFLFKTDQTKSNR